MPDGANVPRALSMIWGEGDEVYVELEGDPGSPPDRAVLFPGDFYSWTPPSRPDRAFEIHYKEI